MLRYWILAVCFLTGGYASAEAINAQVDTDKKPWTHLNALNNPDEFQFAIVTDRTGGARQGIFMDGVRKLNLMRPEFVMSVGDLINGYTENLDQLNREWDEFNGFVDQLDMPFFYVPGNHDITNDVMTQLWAERFGPSYYHFVYRDVLFLCLNSEDPPNTQMSDKQVAYVEKALNENPDVRWTMVFIHKPLWIYPGKKNWKRVEEMLQGRRHSVFAGHTHNYMRYERNDEAYIVLATMGGGSGLRGPAFGEFDHFMWVTMTEEGPRIANLMLNGIWDTHVRTPEHTALLRGSLNGGVVRTEPIVVHGEIFDGAETVLRLTNDADVPAEVEVFLESTEEVTVSRTSVRKKLQPNSVELIDIALTAETPITATEVEPIPIRWKVVYDLEESISPMTIEGQHRVGIHTQWPLYVKKTDISLDGDLDDWSDEAFNTVPGPGALSGTTTAWYGAPDLTMRQALRYDDDFLYVALKVEDDEQAPSNNNFRRTDSVEIRLDARPAADRAKGADFKDWILLAFGAGRRGPVQLFEADKLPDGIDVATKSTDTGYAVEVRIPMAYIEAQGGKDWEDIRLNIAVNDHDRDGYSKIWWQPDWNATGSYVGSGVFERLGN